MKENNTINKWMIWVIFASSLLSIATPGIAIIPTVLSLVIAIKFIVVSKNAVPDYLKIQTMLNHIKDLELKKERLNKELDGLNNQIKISKDEINKMQILLEENEQKYDFKQVFPFEYDEVDSLQINNFIKKLNLKEKELANVNEIISHYDLKGETKQIYKNQLKQIFRLFNAETSLILNKVTSKKYDTCQNQIFTAYTSINKIFETDGVQIPEELLDIKLEKLSLLYKHAIKLEEEKEIRREEKERLKEEKRVELELKNKLSEIDKDIKHHNNEIMKLTKYLSKTNTEVEQEIYIDKIKKLELKIEELNESKSDVEERQIKAQSGYVYIISNIGSFGENIYKIGVTRRLDPMERIKELSSASVPFEFDVHALVFSDNAFALEDRLHKHFRKYQVNKVNNKKEFFNVKLEDIKQLINSEYNETVEFTIIPKAEQYRQSLALSEN